MTVEVTFQSVLQYPPLPKKKKKKKRIKLSQQHYLVHIVIYMSL